MPFTVSNNPKINFTPQNLITFKQSLVIVALYQKNTPSSNIKREKPPQVNKEETERRTVSNNLKTIDFSSRIEPLKDVLDAWPLFSYFSGCNSSG